VLVCRAGNGKVSVSTAKSVAVEGGKSRHHKVTYLQMLDLMFRNIRCRLSVWWAV
jgi:hypothetical protein